MKIENLLFDIHHKMIKNTEEERRLRNTHDYVNENEEVRNDANISNCMRIQAILKSIEERIYEIIKTQ